MISVERLVVDASVAVKWYVPEAGSEAAAALLHQERQLLAPDLIVPELGNTIWNKTRRGELTAAEAASIIGAFTATSLLSIVPSTPLLAGAVEIAMRFDRSVYDAVYLALAVVEEIPFLTADERLVRSLTGTSIEGIARMLM